MSTRLLLPLLLAVAVVPGPVRAQADAEDDGGTSAAASAAPEGACGHGTVGRIRIRNHSLFAPEDIRDHRFQWALGFANWVHVRTRQVNPGRIAAEYRIDAGSGGEPDAHT